AYNCQPYACARIFLTRIQALKDIEDSIVILHIEPNTVITHPDQMVLRRFFRSNLNTRIGNLSRELHCIIQIVPQRLREPVPIRTPATAVDIHDEVNRRRGRFPFLLLDYRLNQRSQFDLTSLKLASLET